MMMRIVTLAIAPVLTAPILLQDCQGGPTWETSSFAVVVERCSVTVDGRTSIEDVDGVVVNVESGGSLVSVSVPVACLGSAPLSATVDGAHVEVEAGIACAVPSPNGSSESAWLDGLSFDGTDADGDGVYDQIEGTITVGWDIEEVVGPAIVHSEHVECDARVMAGGLIEPVRDVAQ